MLLFLYKMPSYIVVEVYYKNGEYIIESFTSQYELTAYLIDDLIENKSWCREYFKDEKLGYYNLMKLFENMQLIELITVAKKLGKQVIKDEGGCGVVEVIQDGVLL